MGDYDYVKLNKQQEKRGKKENGDEKKEKKTNASSWKRLKETFKNNIVSYKV